MTEDQGGDRQLPASGGLPDFSSQGTAGGPGGAAGSPGAAPLPSFSSEHGPVTLGEPSERARKKTLALTLSVIGTAVVLLAIVALVLSQTVFRSVLDDKDPTAFPTGPRSAEGQSEYVPDPEDPDIAPPPPLFTQAPTTECSLPRDGTQAARPAPGTVRGGDLQYTPPPEWDFPWHHDVLPYLSEVGGQGRNVEGSWYSVVSLGRVSFPEDEGGYPGLESAAVAIFQCYATTSGVITTFGENPEVTDYRTEPLTVDGYPAWIVQATYHFEDPDQLATSSASIVTSIVVEGPDGPSGLASDVAADHPDHVANLEAIIASLEVVE